MDVAAQMGKSLRFSNGDASDARQVLDASLNDRATQTRQFVVDCTALGYIAFKIRQAIDDASHNRREERLLVGKVGINRRLARGSHHGNLIDARTPEALFQKKLFGCIKDSPFHVAGKVLRRSAGTRAQT